MDDDLVVDNVGVALLGGGHLFRAAEDEGAVPVLGVEGSEIGRGHGLDQVGVGRTLHALDGHLADGDHRGEERHLGRVRI